MSKGALYRPISGASEQSYQPYRFLRRPFSALLMIYQKTIAFAPESWIFYSVTSNGPVPLPDTLAEAFSIVPQPFTYLVTLLSTGISIATAFLYSRAIRHLLTISLTKPVSLFAITSVIRVAGKSPIKNFKRPAWTVASIICALALSAQTAGWATLLSPRIIELSTGVSGFTLDITNPEFLALSKVAFGNGELDVDTFTSIVPLIEQSGSAAASACIGLPAIFNFNRLSFINTTGGILPANLYVLPSAITPNESLPVVTFLDQILVTPNSFSRNYTVTQQGLTAEVDCHQQNLTSTTSPSVSINASQTTFAGQNIIAQEMTIGCPGGLTINASPVYGPATNDTGDPSGLFFGSCASSDNVTTQAIVTGIGNYAFIGSVVCTIRPKATIVDVRYIAPTSIFQVTNTTQFPSFIDVGNARQSTDAPEAGLLPLKIIDRAFAFAQGVGGNSIGDTLSSFFFSSGVTEDPTLASQLVTDLVGDYIKGVFEFSGTLLRASYTETNNQLFPNGTSDIPKSMRMRTNGTFVAETAGWQQRDAVVPAALLAPTFVTVLSIVLAVIAVLRTRNADIADDQDYFDPNNILHVMAAASAGGLPETFPPFSADKDDYFAHGQSVKVRFGHVKDNGRLGFVHAHNLSYP
ncbi:hypothetical protein BDN72DRAFT_919749 [Pluteus cervinus]|uniref:Uncharacterized protein n=1 Tax=Pluteus cervinus TaxID=181527 RepID=A0ACD3B789_9AGAR|nr:hypothetical protein BDN72DRAFT_919749 [Pluteus cervinus]